MSTNFLFSKVCWQHPAMFCLYTSSKLSPHIIWIWLNPGYLLKSFLLYLYLKNKNFLTSRLYSILGMVRLIRLANIVCSRDSKHQLWNRKKNINYLRVNGLHIHYLQYVQWIKSIVCAAELIDLGYLVFASYQSYVKL